MIRWSASVVAHFKVAGVCTLPSASCVLRLASWSLRSAVCGLQSAASAPSALRVVLLRERLCLDFAPPNPRLALPPLVPTHSGARPSPSLRRSLSSITPRHHCPPAAIVSRALRPLIRAWYSTGGNCRPDSSLPRSFFLPLALSFLLLLLPLSFLPFHCYSLPTAHRRHDPRPTLPPSAPPTSTSSPLPTAT